MGFGFETIAVPLYDCIVVLFVVRHDLQLERGRHGADDVLPLAFWLPSRWRNLSPVEGGSGAGLLFLVYRSLL